MALATLLLVVALSQVTTTSIVSTPNGAAAASPNSYVVNSPSAASSPIYGSSPIATSAGNANSSLLGTNYNENLYKDIIAKHRAFRVYADEDFQYKCLDRINAKRRLHESTRPLSLGFNFTKYTVDRAHSILRDIENKQDITKGRYALGESFFWYYDPTRYRSIEDAVSTWYSESRNYDYHRPGFSAKTGGFTQLVWKSSREVSCAKIEYETHDHFKTLLVCNFYPAGNVNGEFPYNVLPVRKTGSKPDYDEPDYPVRPNRPSRPDRPERPDYDPRPPSRPDYDPRPPSRPDYDPRPPPSRPDRPPSRPDYDPRPPPLRPDDERPGHRPRPPYDGDDRPTRPGGYPTHPVIITGTQETILSSAARTPSSVPETAPAQAVGVFHVPGSAQIAPQKPEPTPVQYAPAVLPMKNVGAPSGSVVHFKGSDQVYEPVEALLVLPQYGSGQVPSVPQTMTL